MTVIRLGKLVDISAAWKFEFLQLSIIKTPLIVRTYNHRRIVMNLYDIVFFLIVVSTMLPELLVNS